MHDLLAVSYCCKTPSLGFLHVHTNFTNLVIAYYQTYLNANEYFLQRHLYQHDRFLLVLISQISGRKMGDGGEWSCGSQNEPLNWKHLQYTILNQNNNALWYSVISSCALRTCTHTITLGSQPHHAHSQLANSMPLVSIPHYCSLLNQAGESPCCSRIFSLFLLLSSC